MCKSSGVSAEINFDQLEFLEGVFELANDGIIPGGSNRNLEYVSTFVSFLKTFTEAQKLMTADAQTSGGLLVALPQSQAEEFANQCAKSTGLPVQQIGVFTRSAEKIITIS